MGANAQEEINELQSKRLSHTNVPVVEAMKDIEFALQYHENDISDLKKKAKVYTYDTMVQAQYDTSLVAGDIIEVLGYYTKGDGGCHKRIVSATDDGSGISCGSLWLNYIFEDGVNALHFGAKQSETIDSSEYFQKAIVYCLNKNYNFFATGKFCIKNSIYIKEYYPTDNIKNRVSSIIDIKGVLYIDGCIGFVSWGNNITYRFEKVLCTNNGSLVKTIDCGYVNIKFTDVIGQGSNSDGICFAGTFDGNIEGNSLIGFEKCVNLRVSDIRDNYTTPYGNHVNLQYGTNRPKVIIQRLGGDFVSVDSDPSSSNYGIYCEGVFSAYIDSQIEYVTKTFDSVGLYIDNNSHFITVVNGYFESINKHFIECYGTHCEFDIKLLPSNRELKFSDFKIYGMNNNINYEIDTALGNDFLTYGVNVHNFDVSDTNTFNLQEKKSLTSGQLFNFLKNSNELINNWDISSPTGDTLSTRVFSYDKLLDELGGTGSTLITTSNTGTHQINQTFLTPTDVDTLNFSVKLQGVSGKIMVMLKVIDGETVKNKRVYLKTSNKITTIYFPIDSKKNGNTSVVLQWKGENGSSFRASNLICSEGINSLDFTKNFGNERPVSIGGTKGKDLFNNLNVQGRIKLYPKIMGSENKVLETIEHSTYILPQIGAQYVITLPKINETNKINLNGSEITFLSSAGGGFNWAIDCASGDKYSDNTTGTSILANGHSLTLIAYGNVWYIKSKY